MSFFGKKNNNGLPTEVKRIDSVIGNTYIAIAFTVINIILYLAKADYYFLFSLYFPYIWFDPKMPVDCVIAAVVLAAFGLFAFFAKKKPGFIIGLLVLTALDTVFLASEIFILADEGYADIGAFIPDIAFHIWLLVYICLGTAAVGKYKAYLADGTAETANAVGQYSEYESPRLFRELRNDNFQNDGSSN